MCACVYVCVCVCVCVCTCVCVYVCVYVYVLCYVHAYACKERGKLKEVGVGMIVKVQAKALTLWSTMKQCLQTERSTHETRR